MNGGAVTPTVLTNRATQSARPSARGPPMATEIVTQERAPARRTNPLTAWSLAAGGVLFVVGGAMHPAEDRPELSMAQQLRFMYEDPAWYPAHSAMFAGMVLITVA